MVGEASEHHRHGHQAQAKDDDREDIEREVESDGRRLGENPFAIAGDVGIENRGRQIRRD